MNPVSDFKYFRGAAKMVPAVFRKGRFMIANAMRSAMGLQWSRYLAGGSC